MYNWSTDEKQFKKADPRGYRVWRLEQTINYGEPGERLDKVLVKRHWMEVRNRINPGYRRYLEFLLWPKKRAS